MKSILFLIETIYCNIFRCNYIILETKKFFSNFFFLKFRNLDYILNIFKKKMSLIPDIFFDLGTPKNVVR